MVYFKLFESQVPVMERVLSVASRMVGTERSRGYCLEMICADFLAGRTEESTPEETLLLIDRLVRRLPGEYRERYVKRILQECGGVWGSVGSWLAGGEAGPMRQRERSRQARRKWQKLISEQARSGQSVGETASGTLSRAHLRSMISSTRLPLLRFSLGI